MRVLIVILLSLILNSVAVRADETLPVLKVGTDIYTNVTVTSVTPTDIYFTCAKGMLNAKLKNLDPALQKHFKYDAAKADAVEKNQRSANVQYANPVGAGADQPIDRANAQSIMDDAIARVKAIVNQPVRQLAQTPDMNVSVYKPGWFHDGAEKPNFNTVDIRPNQKLSYEQSPYVTSDLNPGVVFIGPELEFNSMTKYFYVDRTLPKKKLTETEMLEINRLYRIMGKCEAKLDPTLNPESPSVLSLEFLSLHKNTVIAATLAALLLLLAIRFLTGRRAE
jgi:hypothetical protein